MSKTQIPISPAMRHALAEFRQARADLMKLGAASAARHMHGPRASRPVVAECPQPSDDPHAEGGVFGMEWGKDQ